MSSRTGHIYVSFLINSSPYASIIINKRTSWRFITKGKEYVRRSSNFSSFHLNVKTKRTLWPEVHWPICIQVEVTICSTRSQKKGRKVPEWFIAEFNFFGNSIPMVMVYGVLFSRFLLTFMYTVHVLTKHLCCFW